jgi:hypothetical protein
LCSWRRKCEARLARVRDARVNAACPIWQKTDGRGGYDSIEGDPDVASNTQVTIEARASELAAPIGALWAGVSAELLVRSARRTAGRSFRTRNEIHGVDACQS